jgi:outer membrane murein-binding lipoprotein Lpp
MNLNRTCYTLAISGLALLSGCSTFQNPEKMERASYQIHNLEYSTQRLKQSSYQLPQLTKRRDSFLFKVLDVFY